MATAKVRVLRTHFNRNLCPWLMEGDVGRDTNKSYGCWAGMVTLRRTENP